MGIVKAPIPPKNAHILRTPCEFCIVGCGYIAYKWPVGEDGDPNGNNIWNMNLAKQLPAYSDWVSQHQHQRIKEQDNKEYNLVVIPDKDCFVNKGLHSIRGGTLAAKCYNERARIAQDRLLAPFVYEDDRHTETTWSEASDLVSRVVKECMDRWGPDAIAMKFFDHGMGGGGFENNWAVGKFFFTGVGTKIASIHNRPAYNSEVFAAGDAGTAALNTNYFDAELADTIMLIGANSLETQTNFWWAHAISNLNGTSLGDKKKEFSGEPSEAGRIIIVDPRRTPTIASAQQIAPDRTLHLDLEPGTDIILINAIARIIYEKGWHGRDFIEKYTEASSWENYKKISLRQDTSLKDVIVEAEKITGVSQAKMVKAAEWIAEPKGTFRKRTWIGYEKGVIWGIKNYENVAAVIGLGLLTDNLSTRPGTGCTRMGGHQEGYVRPGYPGPRPPIYVDDVLDKGAAKVFWIGGCDPVNTTLDAMRMRKLLRRRGQIVNQAIDASHGKPAEERVKAILDAVDKGGLFVIAQNIYFVDTAKYSHVVLPAARWGEHYATTMNGERRVRLFEKLYDPPGEARPDFIIMAEIAEIIENLYAKEGKAEMAQRFSGFDWIKGKNAREIAEKCFMDGAEHSFPAADSYGIKPIEAYRGLSYDMLKQFGNNGVILPVTVKNGRVEGVHGERTDDGRIRGTRLLHSDHKFYGQDGKAKFIPSQWPGYPKLVASQKQKYRFWINNGRLNHIWQTEYYELRMPLFKDRYPMSILEVNPEDAKDLGLQSGDIVEVYNDFGSVRGLAYVTENVKKGHAFMVFGSPKGSVNVVVTNHVDPDTIIPYYKGTWGNIRRIGSSRMIRDTVSFKDTRVYG